MHSVYKHMHQGVVTYLYSFTFNVLVGKWQWILDMDNCSCSERSSSSSRWLSGPLLIKLRCSRFGDYSYIFK